MKFLLLSFFLFSASVLHAQANQAVIIDHTCTDISKIPQDAVKKAKRQFKAAFAHSSAGNQIVLGMEALMKSNPLYSFNKSGNDGALSFLDSAPKGDLGTPSRTKWAERTREFLKDQGSDRNLIIWCWGGQVSSASEKDIRTYLDLMAGLEKEFPKVKFVYMTGRLDGNGPGGVLNKRNEQIREYCRKNGKILFDFADLESYDPDGKTNYMDLGGYDNGDYQGEYKIRNWVDDWLMKHPKHQMALPPGNPHMKPLLAALKSRALWWMLARLSGWDPVDPSADYRPDLESGPPQPPAEPAQKTEQKKTAPEKKGEIKNSEEKTFTFAQNAEYKEWMALGTNEGIVPKSGGGLLIPAGGKPAAAFFKKNFIAEELEFKARLEEGSQINWFVNIAWDGSWAPAKGVGGVINNEGCIITVNGEKKKIPSSPRLDNRPHHFQIVLENGKLLWGMDGKIIAETAVPPEIFSRKGITGIGSWDSKVRVSAVYLRGRE